MPSFGAGTIEYHGTPVDLAPSAVRTTSADGSTHHVGGSDTARLTLAVTAASGGTPSLTVTVQHSPDASTWAAVSAFAAKTGTGSERKVFGGLDRYVRASWAITGTTPSFTFSVSGEIV